MRNFLFWLSRKIDYPLIQPQIIQISMTYRCNLKCRMCSIAGLSSDKEELTTGQITHIIDEAKDYGIKEVLFTGGEPLLREDFFEICRYCRSQGLRSIVTTNGTLINEDTASQLIEAGVGHLHFSLDGMEETNDYFRGKGVFGKVLASIENLKRKNNGSNSPSIGIATTIMDKNISELLEIVKLSDRLKVDVISFQPLIYNNANFLEDKPPLFWPRGDQIYALQQEIKRVQEYKGSHVFVHQEPDLRLFIKYYSRSLSRKDWVCFGGFKTIFICYSQNNPLVYSCHGICGDLSKASLRQAWHSKEARRLRLHSKHCDKLCLQSCYSVAKASNLRSLMRSLSER